MRKNCKLISLVFFLTFTMSILTLSPVHAAASGKDSSQAKVEAILGMKSVGDYNWKLSSDGTYWYSLDVCYVAAPVNAAYQTMSIFVPAAYLKQDASGKAVFTDKVVNGYNVNTAPIYYHCDAGGYRETKASSSVDAKAVASGFIYVSPGHRGPGTTSINSAGQKYFDGKSPYCLVDLKAGIRYLKFNDKSMPGNSEMIVTSAGSGGGAMSSFLACNANDPVYDNYLRETGAIMSVGDNAYASNCYCPITNLANADMAYEWFFGIPSQLQSLKSTKFQTLLSGYLSKGFVEYINKLGYTEEELKKLLIGQLEWSANYYMDELKNGESKIDWSDKAVFKDAAHPTLEEIAKNYIAGYYTKTSQMPGGMGGGMAPGGPGGAQGDDRSGGMPGGAPPNDGMPGGTGSDQAAGGAGVAQGGGMGDGPQGGGMPPGGAPSTGPKEGKDISNWMSWDKKTRKVIITSLANFKEDYQRMKEVTSFDVLNAKAGETVVFGDRKTESRHWSRSLFDVLTRNKDSLKAAWSDADAKSTGYKSFDDLYAAYKSDVAAVHRDEYGNDIVDLYNPMLFIDSDKSYLNGDVAKHVRIRTGTVDPHTSPVIALIFWDSLKKRGGVDVNFEYIWDEGHGDREQDNQTLYMWIDEICASVKKKQ